MTAVPPLFSNARCCKIWTGSDQADIRLVYIGVTAAGVEVVPDTRGVVYGNSSQA